MKRKPAKLTRSRRENPSRSSTTLQMTSALVARVASIFGEHRISLGDLVREIREEGAGMPLTIIVHGDGSATSSVFLDAIEPYLQPC